MRSFILFIQLCLLNAQTLSPTPIDMNPTFQGVIIGTLLTIFVIWVVCIICCLCTRNVNNNNNGGRDYTTLINILDDASLFDHL